MHTGSIARCGREGDASLAGHFRQMREPDSARKALQDRLQREQMGDEAYDAMVRSTRDRSFVVFGVIFIVAMGVLVFGIALFGW